MNLVPPPDESGLLGKGEPRNPSTAGIVARVMWDPAAPGGWMRPCCTRGVDGTLTKSALPSPLAPFKGSRRTMNGGRRGQDGTLMAVTRLKEMLQRP